MCWVSIDESYPEPSTQVLVYSKKWHRADVCYYTTYNEWWPEGLMIFPVTEITHWHALPENQC